MRTTSSSNSSCSTFCRMNRRLQQKPRPPTKHRREHKPAPHWLSPLLPPMAPSPRRLSSAAGDDAIVALEPSAAPRTADLPDSDLLPADLEARFRKLKSFRVTIANSPSGSPREKRSAPRRLDPTASPSISPIDARNRKAPMRSSSEGDQDRSFPAPETSAKTEPKSKSDLGSSPSSSLPFGSSKEQLASSPSTQCCCFVFSPKKVVAQSRKAKGGEVLPGSSVHALEKEKRKLRKALREQEKLTKEAAKMVRWARQASKRMNAGSMDEFLNHGEEEFK